MPYADRLDSISLRKASEHVSAVGRAVGSRDQQAPTSDRNSDDSFRSPAEAGFVPFMRSLITAKSESACENGIVSVKIYNVFVSSFTLGSLCHRSVPPIRYSPRPRYRRTMCGGEYLHPEVQGWCIEPNHGTLWSWSNHYQFQSRRLLRRVQNRPTQP